MYIQGKILKPEDDLSEVLYIRNKVFVEEYGIPYNMEFDDMDGIAVHALAYERLTDTNTGIIGEQNKIAIATGRLLYDGEYCRIEKISVLKEFRGKKYGDFIVRLLLNKAFIAGIERVYVDSYLSTEGFFKKIGFTRDSDGFIDESMRKCRMIINDCSLRRNCSNKNT
jgi:predicted GNAT family N-acyltransferase